MTDDNHRHRVEVLLRKAGQCAWADTQVRRATGRDYNLFEVLGIEHYEVWTHSPILADLLNPEGRHGQGAIFLRLFIDIVNDLPARKNSAPASEKFPLDVKTATVSREKSIGKITETSGGRIDISITDRNGHLLIIENKIYALDQDKQLQRYCTYAELACRGKPFRIVYLTLDGHDAPDEMGRNPEIRFMSYRDHILQWLMACQQAAVNIPQIRDNLAQYIQVVRKLTNQSNSTTMNQEIAKIVLANEDTLESYYTLIDAKDSIERPIVEKLKEQIRKISEELHLSIVEPIEVDLNKEDSGWHFSTGLLAASNLEIGFGFDGIRFQKIYFGFVYIDKNQPTNAPRLRDEFEKVLNRRVENSNWWPAFAWGSAPDFPCSTHETMRMIQSGKLKEIISDTTKRLLQVAESALGNGD